VLAASRSQFETNPVGKYVLGNGFAVGCVDRSLYVTVLAGRPDSDLVHKLVDLWLGVMADMFEGNLPPHASLFDAHGVKSIDVEAFATATAYHDRYKDVLPRILSKQALVRPNGLPGTIVNGYAAVFPFVFPTETFEDSDAALTWLEREDAREAHTEVRSALMHDPLVHEVRLLLTAEPALSLVEVAKRLHCSTRSLQRQLVAAGTGFRAEAQAAQLAEAKRLLSETDNKLLSIALHLGFRTLQSFSTTFRRATGVSPSAWRVNRRTDNP
jgi:AraC-like DNA-binding protein